MAQITYTNKVALNENPEIADINKVTDDDMNEIKSVVNTNDDNVGDITTLTTTTKTSTVSAINELNSTKATSNDVGNIANLTTTDKTSVVNAVNELNSNKASKNEVIISDTQPSASDNKLWIDTSALSQSDETNMKYNDNGTYKDIYAKAFDTLPVGAEVDYDGQTVPDGWTQIDDNPKVLWQNSDVTQSFSAQDITLSDNISNYRYYEIICKRGTTTTSPCFATGKIPSNQTTQIMMSSDKFYYRSVISVSGTTMTFGDGRYYDAYAGNNIQANGNVIPYQVLGYK